MTYCELSAYEMTRKGTTPALVETAFEKHDSPMEEVHVLESHRKPRIVVVGSANMDLVVRTKRIPAPGETVLGGEFFQLPGGKGANQAVAAARLGGDVTFIGCVGKDAFGDSLLAGLT